MAVIGTNTSSLNAALYLNVANSGLTKSIKRLSSGSKLANPEDDAAGVAVSGKLDAQINRLSAAVDGANNLVSFAQTADGYLKTVQDQLTRMSELATRSTNGAFSASDRANYSTEFEKLSTNITNQISNAKFNGTAVFGTGSVSTTITSDGTAYDMNLVDASTSVTDVAGLDITTTAGASAAITTLTTALENVAGNRATMSAEVSSLSFYVQNLSTEKVNISAANSRLKDTDFADESANLAKFNILTQSATAMLAQANTSQQGALALLR